MTMMRGTTMTTKKRSRSSRQMGTLKFAVAAGSLAASLLGARLLAQQDEGLQTAVSAEPIVINVPISASSSGFPEAVLINPSTGNEVSLDLAPITEAVSPQILPIASSRSSK